MKKRISVLIPTYNEEENVVPLSEAIVAEFQKVFRNMSMKLFL